MLFAEVLRSRLITFDTPNGRTGFFVAQSNSLKISRRRGSERKISGSQYFSVLSSDFFLLCSLGLLWVADCSFRTGGAISRKLTIQSVLGESGQGFFNHLESGTWLNEKKVNYEHGY